MPDQQLLSSARREVEQALRVLAEKLGPMPRAPIDPGATPADLLTLLAKGQKLARRGDPASAPVLRSVHHFACAGGTLISRCIASMPNTRVLSELDPLSPMAPHTPFMPTDLISLLKISMRSVDQDELVNVFLAGLKEVYRQSRLKGEHLVLRDHTHSHFTLGKSVPTRPTFRQILMAEYQVISLVTIRHPLDSYLSLNKNGWVGFSPATLEEYSCRYLDFLNHYKDVPTLRYEDFVLDPETEMQNIADLLDLKYNPDFQQIFPVIQLSGDSGRKSNVIGPRPRQTVSPGVAEETRQSVSYRNLCTRMGYDHHAS